METRLIQLVVDIPQWEPNLGALILQPPPTSAPRLTAIIVGSLSPVNGYPLTSVNSFVISASGGGALIASGNPNSGGFQSGFSTTATSTPSGIQIQKTSAGSASFSVQWGSSGQQVSWTTTFT